MQSTCLAQADAAYRVFLKNCNCCRPLHFQDHEVLPGMVKEVYRYGEGSMVKEAYRYLTQPSQPIGRVQLSTTEKVSTICPTPRNFMFADTASTQCSDCVITLRITVIERGF